MTKFSFCRRLFILSILAAVALTPSFSSGAQIRFAWNSNAEPDLAGYKVYYGTASKAYGPPIDIGKMTHCTLTNLVSGQTYYIAVTAYDAHYNESAYSAEARGVATESTLSAASIGVYLNGTWSLDMNDNDLWDGCTTDLCFYYGIATDIPLMGDWDGDGIKTPGVYRPSTSEFLLSNSNTSGFADIVVNYGIPGDIPIVGDWTGNGYDSVGIYRPSNSKFYLRNSNTSGFGDSEFQYGIPGDIPIAGDWTGNGYDSVGIYRPSNSKFYLRNSNTSGFGDSEFQYGIPGDIPIVGDWNGNGYDSVGIYRPRTGEFHLRNNNTSGPADEVVNFGIPNGKPLVW